MFIDAYALIVQKDLDGGDTLQREGMYAFGKWLRYNKNTNQVIMADAPPRQSPDKIMDQLEVEPGIYIRHPDPKKWYSNPDSTSRDQLIGVFAYCAAYQDHPRLWRLFKSTLKRGMFAQNTLRIGDGETERKIPDPMPLTISLFIRAGGWWTSPLYPVLIATDMIDLLGTVLNIVPLHWKDDHIFPRWRIGSDVDDNNGIIQHLIAAEFKPTAISWLSRYIYSVSRAQNDGNFKLGEKNAVMGALRWYHRSESGNNGNPEIAELYRPLVEDYFSFRSPKEFIVELLERPPASWPAPR